MLPVHIALIELGHLGTLQRTDRNRRFGNHLQISRAGAKRIRAFVHQHHRRPVGRGGHRRITRAERRLRRRRRKSVRRIVAAIFRRLHIPSRTELRGQRSRTVHGQPEGRRKHFQCRTVPAPRIERLGRVRRRRLDFNQRSGIDPLAVEHRLDRSAGPGSHRHLVLLLHRRERHDVLRAGRYARDFHAVGEKLRRTVRDIPDALSDLRRRLAGNGNLRRGLGLRLDHLKDIVRRGVHEDGFCVIGVPDPGRHANLVKLTVEILRVGFEIIVLTCRVGNSEGYFLRVVKPILGHRPRVALRSVDIQAIGARSVVMRKEHVVPLGRRNLCRRDFVE